MNNGKKDVNLDFRVIASSPIVIVGDKATMLLKNNGTGNLMVFPLFLDYDSSKQTDEDFRIDYFHKLIELNGQGKLKNILFFNYEDSKGTREEIIVGPELFEVLCASMDFHNKKLELERALKKYPMFLRPFMRMDKFAFIIWFTTLAMAVFNVIILLYGKK